jgi:acyl transferase domain-containing protein/thioesterase domain-containing protein/acyl carrier protein
MTAPAPYEPSPTDIAIVGMACHLPDASGPRAYWRNLCEGVESVRTFSDDELRARGVDPAHLRRANYVRSGVVLDSLEQFDAGFFGFSPKDASILDPQHRHFLECCWEALEDAGHTPEQFRGPIGVFAGSGMAAYMAFNVLTNRELVESVGLFLLRHTGNDKDFLTTRVSYNFDLRGPSVNIQTACSTSLVAAHVACQSLLSGECDMALAGGVTMQLPHRIGYLYHENEILTPDGHCRPFEARSKGTIFGSGAGVVVLRRMSDALEDGDHIYAVIRGTAINNDGARKVGYLAPSVDGQAAAIAEALRISGVDARSIGYVEAHGTGTAVGDPIEVAALTRAFRTNTDARQFCGLGSVKSNIGHLDTAAGVASLIKVALALRHGRIPATLHYERPNPNIDFEGSPFFVAGALREWQREDEPRRGAVNSLGVGGTNAFAILEEPPPATPTKAQRSQQLLVLSARTDAALASAALNLKAHLEAEPELQLADAAWTLQVGRKGFAKRRAIVVRDRADALEKLAQSGTSTNAAATAPSLVFLLPGGGAQYPAMGRDLRRNERVYREEVERCLAWLDPKVREPIAKLLDPAPGEFEEAAKLFERPALQLPALFITEYALAKLWMSWGFTPTALLGHSMGENTAACIAGVMSPRDALGLVALRGELFERAPAGGMLSVELAPEDLQPLLGPELSLGVVNAPKLCVASGPTHALEALGAELQRRGVEFRRIHINIAAHSALVDGVLPEFTAYLRRIQLSPPKIPIVSNLTGDWLSDEQATSPEYWARHLRGTVQFAKGVATVLAGGERLLLEVGPGNTLSSLARMQCTPAAAKNVVSSLRHRDEQISDVEFALGVVGKLWCAGLSVDWRAVAGGSGGRRVSLPTYPFERQRHWIEPTPVQVAAAAQSLTKEPDVERWFYEPRWKRVDEPGAAESQAVGERWLVFAQVEGVGDLLAHRLAERGASVVIVHPSDQFQRFAPDHFGIVPQEREHYAQLLEELAREERLPTHIAHTWLVTGDESTAVTTTFFHWCLEHGFYSLLFLGQALGALTLEQPVHLDVVSNGMQRVGDEPLRNPAKSTALGVCRVLPREMPGVSCASIDIVLPQAPRRRGKGGADSATFQLLDQIAKVAGNGVFALRDGALHELGYERVAAPPLPPAGSLPALRERGVCLITGGLGGVAMVAAEELARRSKARLVLLSRRKFPVRAEWERWLAEHSARDATARQMRKLLALEALGAEVLVARGDVANIEDMRRVVAEVEQRFGALHAVFHAAGALDDGPLQVKTPAGVDHVFTPKIHGAILLDELLPHGKLDFFAVCSSTSAVLGPAGQVDYAAANAFLDAFAEHRNARGAGRTLSIAWGVWNQVGMTARGAAGAQAPHELTAASGQAHALLGRRFDGGADEIVYLAEHSCRTHWVLDEHRLAGGAALAPGVAHLQLLYCAAREGLGWSGAVELRDVSFLSPLRVRDDELREVRVRLERSGDGWNASIASRGADDGEDAWQLHAQGHLARSNAAAGTLSLEGATFSGRSEALASQGAHLRFGPRWANVDRVVQARDHVLATLALPAAYAADLGVHVLHPALLDMATGMGLPLIEGRGARGEFYAPLSYKRVTVHAPLAARLVVRAKLSARKPANADIALVDVTVGDEGGRVLLEVEEFALRRMADTSALAGGDTRQPAALPDEEGPLARLIAHGILPEEGAQALARALSSSATRLVVSSIPLDVLATEIERNAARPAATPSATTHAAPNFVAPRDEVERTLAAIWQELLGVERVGAQDNFFELGGYSLVAVRLFARVKKAYKLEYPISVLFEAPTVEALAERIRAELGESAPTGDTGSATPAKPSKPRYELLVPLHAGRPPETTPFFLVAGMYGNIMNLRHLAGHLGVDRPVFGIQARGLDGKSAPHDTFEAMAADYLREVRAAQPHGPYLIGGYSGGGITAYEMAQQLAAAGEEVGLLVFLDTPTTREPELTPAKRLELARLRIARQGVGYFTEAIKRKWSGKAAQWRKALNRPLAKFRPQDFRTENIEAAFYRALALYTIRPYGGAVALFRPPLEQVFTLGPDHVVNAKGSWVEELNGWGPYCTAGVEVHVTPGNHDSMVLEPNVRVLAQRLRERLAEADRVASRARSTQGARA